jgi:hypothetical protein
LLAEIILIVVTSQQPIEIIIENGIEYCRCQNPDCKKLVGLALKPYENKVRDAKIRGLQTKINYLINRSFSVNIIAEKQKELQALQLEAEKDREYYYFRIPLYKGLCSECFDSYYSQTHDNQGFKIKEHT